MATRMQQRRGTAAQWISTNDGDGPVLEVGEIGFETDTGKFKIGDGTNHWVDLDYFLDESDIDGITGDYVLANTLGQANGVATLDSSGKLTGSQIPGIDELAQDAVDLALVAGTGITKTYNDNANTITLAVDTATIQARVAGVSDSEIGYLANVTSDIQTQLNAKASSTDLSNHESDTSNIHGIADTAELATKEFAANLLVNASKTNITITGDKNGLIITAEGGVGGSDTDDLIEGSTNLYFTNARAQAAVAADISSAINAIDTDDIEEGNNLYFTNERAQDAVGNVVGTGLSYDDNTGAISTYNIPNSSLANSAITINGFAISLGGSASYSSDNIGEGTENLYFTNARARATVSGGTGLDYNQSTGQFDIDSTVTTNTGSQTLTNKNIDLANNTVTGTVAQFNSALSDANFVTTTDTGSITSAMILDETIVNADISNTAAIAQSKIDGLTTDLAAKAALSGATFTGNVVVQQNLQVDGNFTVNGSNVIVSATQIQIEDSILQLAHENAANTVDLGIVAGYNDGTAKHAGLVKDVSDSGKWKLFKGVTTEPSTTVDFTQATLDDLVVGALEATSLTLGNVSNTEFGYLDGVTSGIQSQIDGKISASSTDTLLNKTVNLANNTVSGTVAEFNSALSDANFITTIDTGTVTSTMIADGTIVDGDISASAAISQSKISNLTTDLGNKQDKVSGVSDTEIGYLDGVTSNVQAQIDAKISSSSSDTLTNKTINLANNTISGTISQFNTALSDADFATIAGSETLSNKTLSNVIINGTVTADNSLGSSGQYLESTGNGVRWTSVSGYSAPTLGSTSIASGATVTTISGLTLSDATLNGTLTAGGGAGLNGQVLQSTGTGVAWATVSSGTSLTIENNGSAMTSRPNLNLIGFAISDDAANTETDVVNYAGLVYAAAVFR